MTARDQMRDQMAAEVYLRVNPTPHEAIVEPIIDALIAAGVTFPEPRGAKRPSTGPVTPPTSTARPA